MRWPLLACCAVLIGRPLVASTAQAEELPAQSRALLLLRILAYDRNLAGRAGAAVKVTCLFKAAERTSEERCASLVAALQDVAREVVVMGRPVRADALPYRGAADADAALSTARPTLAYVDAALELSVPEIVRSTRRLGILTASGSKDLVRGGLALGVVAGSRRAGLIVNLQGARLEGADLDAVLLAISEVIGR